MKEKEIKQYIADYLKDRLDLLGISPHEIRKDFDFVQSGLLDSMAFVDMVTSIEKHFGFEIDFEREVDNDNFTKYKGLLKIIMLAGDE